MCASLAGVTALGCNGGNNPGQGQTGSGGASMTASGGATGQSGTGGQVASTGGNPGGSSGGTGGATATGGGSGTGSGGVVSSGGTTGGGGATSTGGTTATGGGGGMTGGGIGGIAGPLPYTCPAGPFTGAIPDGSTATQIANAPPLDAFNSSGADFTNCEGAVWIDDALYFSELKGSPNPPPSRILKIDASDNVTLAFPSIADTGTNGLAVTSDHGYIIGASHGIGGLVAFKLPEGTMTTLLASYNGKRFDSPNDLTIATDGTIYFTDPSFQAGIPLPQPSTGVYRLAPGAAEAEALITNLNNPNGITLSLDGQTLYVGHSSGVYKYPRNTDGSIDTSAPVHVDPADLDGNATDGMAIDCAGNLYITRASQRDIIVVAPSNARIGQIVIPGGGQLTNIAFGGADHRTLYVTAQGAGSRGGTGRGGGGPTGSGGAGGGGGAGGAAGTGTGGASGGINQGRGIFKLTNMPIPGMPY